MMFRHPVDSIQENRDFYQEDYFENDGITTFSPESDEVENLINDGLKGTSRDASRLLTAFTALVGSIEGAMILDYGASWGYMSYQFSKAKMDVESYEISKPRAGFGNQSLKLDIRTSESDVRSNNSIFFSSHVIEHVPSPAKMLEYASQHITQNGFIFTLCPNGSDAFRKRMPKGFSLGWGKVHPNYLTETYFRQYFRDCPYFIASSPDGWSQLALWDQKSQLVSDDVSGNELLIVSCPHQKS